MCTARFLSAGGGGELLTTFFLKTGGLTGHQTLKESCWEKGGGFFREGAAIFT